jgi:hypothetical protein
MLTKLVIERFKRFRRAEVDLANTVVFVGPNNSGKTSALQALALWEVGLRRWNEKRAGKPTPGKRPGVTINRKDLLAVPVPVANLLWRNVHAHVSRKIDGKPKTDPLLIEVTVSGVTDDRTWECGLGFTYANEESLYCKPLRRTDGDDAGRLPVPDAAGLVRVAFLPPMSGLPTEENLFDPGTINVLIGQGRTAEVLRNLCYRLFQAGGADPRWVRVRERIQVLFGVMLDEPEYVAERGQIAMTYLQAGNVRLDLSSAGRGLHQVLLLLAFMETNPGAVVLLDEPDAHLETLRQREIYDVLSQAARESDSQIVIATHSEVLLQEAAQRDVVVAFVGEPHRIDDRGSQAAKALQTIRFDQYVQAEQKGWVLYVEGATDVAVLHAFAETLGHPARELLERPFVHHVGNQPQKARDHFRGLLYAKPDLVGLALFDCLEDQLHEGEPLREVCWRRREIENYLCLPEVLEAYAAASSPNHSDGPLFSRPEAAHRQDVMRECIEDVVPRYAMQDRKDAWWSKTKVSDTFLDPLFARYFEKLGLPNLMRKSGYHQLARLVPKELLDPEVREKLDAIVEVAAAARPRREPDDGDGDA